MEVYFSYYKAANCSGYVPGPCWIPQASSIPGVTTRNLTVCRNWDEYACMTSALRTAKGMADFVCPRSCRERRFEVVSRSAALLKKVRTKPNSTLCYNVPTTFRTATLSAP